MGITKVASTMERLVASWAFVMTLQRRPRGIVVPIEEPRDVLQLRNHLALEERNPAQPPRLLPLATYTPSLNPHLQTDLLSTLAGT